MEPVIGLDVAKGKSVIQAFMKRNEVYGKPETITHDEEGYRRLGSIIQELQVQTGKEPVVVLEATGHYHRPVVAYLSAIKVSFFIVNPLLSKRTKNAQLRKVKTDRADAWHLAEMYYRGDVKPHRSWEECYTELQHVTRQHEFMSSLYVQAKLNTRALLDQVFPAYEEIFSDLFSLTVLKTLQASISSESKEWTEVIRPFTGKSHSEKWIRAKAEHLDIVHKQWLRSERSLAQTLMLQSMITLLLHAGTASNDRGADQAVG